MSSAAIVYAAVMLMQVVFVATSWALVTAVGGRATTVLLGATPPLVTRQVRGVTLRLGLFPSASLELLGRVDDDDSPESWRRLGLARRLAVLLGPWLVMIAVAAACLGPSRMLTSAWHGLHQIFLVLDPTALVRAFFRLAETAPFATVVGIVAAKSAAANLVPLPSLAGWGVVSEVAGPSRSGRESARSNAWMILGALVMLFVSGRFAYAVVRVLIE